MPTWEYDVVTTVSQFPEWAMAAPRALMHISTRFTVPILALLAYLVTLRWRASAAVLAAFVVGAAPSWLTKHLVSRPRPVDLQDIPARDDFYGSGYPSGHVTIAFAAAAAVAPFLLTLPRTRRERRMGNAKHLAGRPDSDEPPRRWALASVPFLLAAAVALGRVYVGAHYPLDLIGGALAGLAGAWFVLALPHFRPTTPSSSDHLPPSAQKLVRRTQNVAANLPIVERWVDPPSSPEPQLSRTSQEGTG